MSRFGVYIIYSKKRNKYYIGSTNDLSRRLKEHNSGMVTSTFKGKPWEIKAFIFCKKLKEARENELRLKKYKRRDIIKKVINTQTFPWDYN